MYALWIVLNADDADADDDAADGDDDADDGEHFQSSQEGSMRYQKLGLWDKTGQKCKSIYGKNFSWM